jgi:ribA/ribD-fused uncharacterized protein
VTQKETKTFDPATLNKPEHIIWFDDFHGDEGKEPTNHYRFLSNFYVSEPLTIPGVEWAGTVKDMSDPIVFQTGEHAFQAFKAVSASDFEDIVSAKSPGVAKRLGRKCALRQDWEGVKLDVMAAVLRAKFVLSRPEGQWLLDTGTALLTEGTFWNDDTWGVKLNQEGSPGRNWLGTLLMARRAELAAEKLHGVTMNTVVHNVDFLLTFS